MGTDPSWRVRQISPNVHEIAFDGISAGWRQRILLTGDRHHDNPQTDRRLEKAHLEEARAGNAPIIDIGDLFDAMQGKGDPRRDFRELTKELAAEDYFDRLVDEAVDFYEPYADLFAVLGTGNHETSVLRHNQTNLTGRLARELARASAVPDRAFAGGYGGYVLLRFTMGGTRRQTLKLKYFHGSGGGGPVTKGVIQTNRRAVYLPDAHFIVTSHIHEAWVLATKQERVTTSGRVSQAIQWHLQVPTYKDEYGAGEFGWHVERGAAPKPVGCGWLELSFGRDQLSYRAVLDAR